MARRREGAGEGGGARQVAGAEQMRDGDEDAEAHGRAAEDRAFSSKGISADRSRSAAGRRPRSAATNRLAAAGESVPAARIGDEGRDGSRERRVVAGRGEDSGLAVADDARHPAIGAGDDRAAERLRLEQSHAVGLVHRRPQEQVGLREQRGEAGAVVDLPVERDASAERCEEMLDLAAGIAVSDDRQGPVGVGEPAEGGRQDAIGGKLVAGSHHGDGEKPQTGPLLAPRRERRPIVRVDEGRQIDEALRCGSGPRESRLVRLRHDEDGVGAIERRLGAGMAELPSASGALAGAGALGDRVGDAQRIGDARPDPVRRLVVDVIGEPQARALPGRAIAIGGDQPIRFRCALGPQPLLNGTVPATVEGAHLARQERREAGGREPLQEEARHGPVAGRGGVVRALQRRIEGNRHRLPHSAASREMAGSADEQGAKPGSQTIGAAARCRNPGGAARGRPLPIGRAGPDRGRAG